MAMIGFAIIYIPKMTNELLELMKLQSIYARLSYSPKGKHSQHIVICGDIKSLSIKEFFDELFHEDHENIDLNAVILQPGTARSECSVLEPLVNIVIVLLCYCDIMLL
jgi:hypothetical protein